ncbi:MAG: hypothetical protein M3137_00960 [Actinomycetota bacterium]|nr:hypothetical protein [Actinomycetota bacterium]
MHLKDSELVNGLADQVEGGALEAAAYARVPTPVGFTRMLTPLGNYFIARPAARSAAGKLTEETGVPLDAAVVLGLSRAALHIWSADPMIDQVYDYLGHVPLARVATMEAVAGHSWQKLTLTLDEGQKLELEARGAIHALVAAFQSRSAT